ncbi:MAG: hypothetical protein ACLR7D_02640 [Lachnospira eligens]
MACKKVSPLTNKVKCALTDSDYRGRNHSSPPQTISDKPVTIEPKDRIAQIVLAPYITASFNEVEGSLTTQERGVKAASAQQAQSKNIILQCMPKA